MSVKRTARPSGFPGRAAADGERAGQDRAAQLAGEGCGGGVVLKAGAEGGEG